MTRMSLSFWSKKSYEDINLVRKDQEDDNMCVVIFLVEKSYEGNKARRPRK